MVVGMWAVDPGHCGADWSCRSLPPPSITGEDCTMLSLARGKDQLKFQVEFLVNVHCFHTIFKKKKKKKDNKPL